MQTRLPGERIKRLNADVADVCDAVLEVEGAGYVCARFKDHTSLLLFRDQKAWCAGRVGDRAAVAEVLSNFFVELQGADEVALYRVELPLFLCLGVLLRKAPSAQIPTELVDSEAILKSLAATGKDAVLAVIRDDAFNLVFCREGVPTVVFAADGETWAQDGSVADRIVEYILTSTSTQLWVFDEIKLPPAKGAGPIEEMAGAHRPAIAKAAILVRLGRRVVFRYPAMMGEVVIGRGDDADLALDNLSVSRRHCVLHVGNSGLVIEDTGSENGVLVNDKAVQKAAVEIGEVITVGKYELELVSPDTILQKSKVPIFEKAPREAEGSSRAPGISGEDTVAISAAVVPVVVHEGIEHRVTGMVFSIGSGAGANLKIGGFLVADVHCVLRRSTQGAWAVKHTAGRRAVRLNGQKVSDASLADGDLLQIAGAEIRFHLPESTRSKLASSTAS